MKITANWVTLHHKRLLKIKARKRDISTDLQNGPLNLSSTLEEKTFVVPPTLPVIKIRTCKSPIIKLEKQQIFRAQNRIFQSGHKNNFDYNVSFQKAISPVLLLAQIFALMPIRGITSKSVRDLKFSWCHVRTIYSLVVLLGFGVYSGFAIAYAFDGKFNFDAGELIVFNISTFLISSSFLLLAQKWSKLMVEWENIESKVPMTTEVKVKSEIAQRIKMIVFVATSCSAIEHVLSMLSIFHYVNGCPVIPGHPIESFLHTTFSQFFYFFEYSNVAGIIGKVLNVLSTFTWNFNDIFVMSVSVGLSFRFRQLNEHMLHAVKRPRNTDFWIRCRVNYRNLCKLCNLLDDDISWITFICFSNNLYFICSKILKSLQKKPSFSHTLYFWFSLLYLLGRTLILSLCTAEINEQAKRPLIVFRSIPRKYWCAELKRFSDEVTNDEVALTGLKLFRLTRRVVLSVAGTIVTYELVLLQFNKKDKVNDCFET